MIQILFAILSFLVSPFGLMSILLGVVSFLMMPFISTASRFKGPANFFLKFATFPIDRAAVVISEHNDALFKTMKFEGLGVEVITIDGEEKVFEDPDNALHHFLGIPFALADEEHGVLFDPRHAAIGMKKKMLDKRNEAMHLATEDEWERWDVAKWMPAVFELPSRNELVDLSAVQELIDGGERSEFAQRVENLYKHSRDPFDDGTPGIKFLYPIIALAITFGGVWFMVSQFGLPFTGSGGGQPDETVSYGGTLLLLISASGISPESIKAWFGRRDWGFIAGVGLMILLPVGIIAGLFLTLGGVMTAGILFAWFLGFLIMPLFTVIGQASKLIAGGLSGLYFKLGFLGFRQPVICWTPSKYVLREYDALDTTEQVEWYDLWGTTVGFSYPPDDTAWDAEAIPHSEVEGMQVDEKHEHTDTNLPSKYARTDKKRDNYGGFVPERVRDGKNYILSGIALERFNNSADGEKSLKKLLEAKEEHGSGHDGLADEVVFKTTLVAGAVGLITAIGVFIVPAFL